MRAGRFVRQASLTWAHDIPCPDDHEVAARTTVDPARLGAVATSTRSPTASATTTATSTAATS